MISLCLRVQSLVEEWHEQPCPFLVNQALTRLERGAEGNGWGVRGFGGVVDMIGIAFCGNLAIFPPPPPLHPEEMPRNIGLAPYPTTDDVQLHKTRAGSSWRNMAACDVPQRPIVVGNCKAITQSVGGG